MLSQFFIVFGQIIERIREFPDFKFICENHHI